MLLQGPFHWWPIPLAFAKSLCVPPQQAMHASVSVGVRAGCSVSRPRNPIDTSLGEGGRRSMHSVKVKQIVQPSTLPVEHPHPNECQWYAHSTTQVQDLKGTEHVGGSSPCAWWSLPPESATHGALLVEADQCEGRSGDIHIGMHGNDHPRNVSLWGLVHYLG